MHKKFYLRINNDISELEKAIQAFNEFIGRIQLSKNVSNALEVTLDEILTNIISYNPDTKMNNGIELLVSVEADHVLLKISDDGKKFNPLKASTPDIISAIDNRPVGGLGLHLVRSMMDEVHYSFKNKRNYLVLKKNIKEI
jgi:anti-sigma regulatory factor (Ser/Thr protein kinase)